MAGLYGNDCGRLKGAGAGPFGRSPSYHIRHWREGPPRPLQKRENVRRPKAGSTEMIEDLVDKQAGRRRFVERLAARWLALERQADGRPVDERKVMAVIRANPHLHDRTLRDAELFLKAYEDVRQEMTEAEPQA